MQTEVQRPAKTRRFLSIALIASMTLGSSQVFIVVRSISAWPGNGAVTSLNIGPEKVFSATVVSTVGTLKPAAPLETKAALLRRSTTSIERVAKAICDWKSIISRAWLVGDSSEAAGVGIALRDMDRFLFMRLGG